MLFVFETITGAQLQRSLYDLRAKGVTDFVVLVPSPRAFVPGWSR
jgi:hypothetical protein